MSVSYRSALVGTTSVVALALASSAPVLAQDNQQAQSVVGLETITVTARRVEENIQRVPIAIQAFTPEKLADQDIKDIWSLTRNIAGLNICCSQGNTSFIFMRGIGNGAPTYFADVPSAAGGFANMFDVSNVQVLKGPQGTLFGQASNAGAIVYTPRKPGEVFGGYVEVSGGQYGRRSIEGAVDLPLIEDKVLFRMAATTYHRDGYAVDITTNKDHGDQNYYILRPSITIRPMENLEIYTMYQLDKSWNNGLPFLLEDFNFSPPTQLSILGVEAQLNAGAGEIPASYLGQGFAYYNATYPNHPVDPTTATLYGAWSLLRGDVLAQQLQLGDYKYNGFNPGCSQTGAFDGSCLFNWNRNHFITNTITYNITDDITIKNIFGYSFGRSFSEPGDTDGSPLTVFDGGNPRNTLVNKNSPQWSDEIQLIWNDMFDGLLDLQLGTFHRAQKNHPQISYGRTLGADFLQTATMSKTSNRSRAIYGQGNLDLSMLLEGLTFTGGLRYTWDKSVQQNWTINPTTGVTTGTSGGAGTPTGEGRWRNLSYTAQLQYQWTPDIMFFINNSRGFGSGGLQNVFGQEKFEPDVLNNIEAGTKATFNIGDWNVRFNGSYFHGWFDDVKASVTKIARRSPTEQDSLIVVTENAAKAIIKGVEADLTVVPTDWLELGGMYAYTDTNYTEWPSLDPVTGNPISLASTPFSFTPVHKWTIRGTYHFPVDSSWGDVSVTANLTRTGNMYNVAKPTNPTNPANPNTGIICFKERTRANFYPDAVADGKRVYIDCVPPHYNLDINFNWRSINGIDGLDGVLSVTNVTKNEVNEGGCYCDVALGVSSPAPYPPRMWSIRLKYAF